MTQIDELVLQLLNHAGESPFADFFFVMFTLLGSLVVALLLAPILWLKGKKESAIDLLVCVTIVYALVELIKVIVARDRPFVALDGAVQTISFYGLAESSGPSFPSGHAARIFAVAAVVSLNAHPSAKIAFFAVATMVALSRVYLGLHWPSDILAGALLGVAVALAIIHIGATWKPWANARQRIVVWVTRRARAWSGTVSWRVA